MNIEKRGARIKCDLASVGLLWAACTKPYIAVSVVVNQPEI